LSVDSSCNTKETNLCTIGETRIIVGKATINANPHAFSHIDTILLTNPTLKTLMTKDIMPDISNDMKNEKTTLWYLREIMNTTHVM
tara:strand:+ start:118 stop:375 length:258 start_codon:yes stop_codon:yes gene_type:complete